MGGRMSKRKGESGERELANLLQGWLGLEVYRALGQAREGGADILCVPGLCIEVKRQEQLNLNKWWEQVNEAATDNDIPVLAYRQNRKQWRFCLPYYLLHDIGEWDTFVELREREFCYWITQHYEDCKDAI